MFKYIYLIGQRFRNPSLNKWFDFLKKSETWSLDELKNYQLKKLQEIIAFAKENSVFYKEILKGLTFEELQDLKEFPIVTKEDLINRNEDIHNNSCNENFIWAKTSGSSGSSLKFKRNESADSFSRAAMNRGYSWHECKPYDFNLYFWGFNFSLYEKVKVRILDFFQNRFRVFDFWETSFNKIIKKSFKIEYIHGYSSMVFELAKKVNSVGNLQFPKLKMIKCTSEQVQPFYLKEINKAFNLPIVSEYGATESGIIAFSCKEGHMHINMEGVYVEEHENEILVTNLHLKSFPIIRYKLGDYLELENENFKCSCGLKHRVIKSIKGRVGSTIQGKMNMYPSLTWYYVFKNLAEKDLSLNYQVVQKEKGEVIIRCSEELTFQDRQMLQKEFDNYFHNDLVFTLEEKYIFPLGKEKKKFFISELDES